MSPNLDQALAQIISDMMTQNRSYFGAGGPGYYGVEVNGVGTPDGLISQLNGWPACAPVNASPPALRPSTHDSGSGWLAEPFPCDSCIHNSLPVCPGALSDRSAQRTSSCPWLSMGLERIALPLPSVQRQLA